MPRIKSQIKSVRQIKKRTLRNKSVKTDIKNSIKKINALLEDKKIEEAEKLFPSLQKKLDKAAAKGIIHKRTAARKKSRLHSKLSSLKEAQ